MTYVRQQRDKARLRVVSGTGGDQYVGQWRSLAERTVRSRLRQAVQEANQYMESDVIVPFVAEVLAEMWRGDGAA